MTTFTQLVDQTLAELRGYSRDQQQSTHVTVATTDSNLTWDVNDASVLSKGRAEIGDEVVWIDSVDRTNNQVTVAPYGRGMDGTTAAVHDINTRLVGNPSFPRGLVKNALNDSISALYAGGLHAVATTTLTFVVAKVTYELPATVEGVLAVTWDVPGPTGVWAPVRRWRFDRNADITTYTNGRTLDVYDSVVPGSTISVVYAKEPTLLSADSDVFATVTGLPASSADAVKYGALARLTMSLDAHLIQNRSVEAGTLVGRPQPGDGRSVSQFYYAMFQQRLAEERARQQSDYPAPVHFTR